MAVQQLKSKVLRWHQLSRYYVNKWQYDGSKWAERVWYGTGSKTPNAVASVPFMITRSMRAELEKSGFPAHEISSMLPKEAHQLLNEKVSYAQFVQQRESLVAAQSSSSEATAEVDEHKEIKEIVAAIQVREAAEDANSDSSSNANASTTNEVAIVPETKEQTERL